MHRRVIGLLLVAALLTAGAGGAVWVNLGRLRDSFRRVEHTSAVLGRIDATEVGLYQAESDQRAWVLSGEPSYREAYRRETGRVEAAMAQLAALVSDNGEQAARAAALVPMIAARLQAFARVVELGPGGRDEALAILSSERQRHTAASLSEALAAMRATEMALLERHQASTERAATYTGLTAAVLAVLTVVGAGVAALVQQRTRALGQVRVANSHLEAILATVPDAMIVFHRDGTIESFSATAQRMFQLDARQALGRPVASLFEGQECGDLEQLVGRAQTTPRRPSATAEMTAQRSDGSRFPVELHVSAAATDGHEQLVAFVRDLSERQARERQAERLRSELLHVSRLINMGEMASALAHELNQPLTALTAYMQGAEILLAAGDLGKLDLVRNALERASAQALRAGDVIRRLREFVDRGETERRIESLTTMVRESWSLARIAEKDVTVRFRASLDPAVDAVLANRIQIEQVLLNLMRNGLEAMRDQAAGERELALSSRPAADGMVEVSVADRGGGIAPDVAARLFRSFVTSKPNGLGVGLSISRTIVETHGGRIWAEANPGGGTIFRFTLRSGTLHDDEPEASMART